MLVKEKRKDATFSVFVEQTKILKSRVRDDSSHLLSSSGFSLFLYLVYIIKEQVPVAKKKKQMFSKPKITL